ncbi:MAG: hypothetical protein Unbinned2072contig1001_29 [Prokaryotic dsDNA virus sp.]|nr:MAG: hypothetical protein Unbinned2072contig1001_29 [Prokaryotic dsDNA virus sp.]|tara:strand:+ start:4114 stop:5286 length:1173 start_codon:yes stop_codon:yes gene_type:complete
MNRKKLTEKLTAKALLFLVVFFVIMLFTANLSAQVIDNKAEDKMVKKYKTKKFIKDIFNYSTFFAAYSESSPLFQPERFFVTQAGEVINVTPEIGNDYLVNIGLRKLARFDYTNKQNRYYDGSERNPSLSSNVGAINGLEYLFMYSKGQQQNRQYKSHRYFVRYSAKYWSLKLESQKNGLINLNYENADLRFRLPIKNLSLSAGASLRTHAPYGYLPIDDYLEENPWWDLAYENGYMDYYYGIDYDNDGQLDNFDWWWANPEGVRIADTDADFRRNHFTDIVNRYNKTELDKIGTLGTLSAVVGLDYYYFRDKFFSHLWANAYPIHKHIIGDFDYSYELVYGSDNWVDYNAGLMMGWNVSQKISIFTEYEITKFWDKKLSFLKTGINLKL